MLSQEELAFIKAMSNLELSPVFLWDLRKSVVTGKKKKPLRHPSLTLWVLRPLSVRAESAVMLLPPASLYSCPWAKRNADKISRSDGLSEPSSHHPAPWHLFSYGPTAQGKLVTKRSQQLGLTEGGLVYTVAVAKYAGCTSLQQPIGLHKPLVVFDHSEPAASSEAATRRTYLRDMSGPLWHAWWHHFRCPSGHK